MCIRGIVLVCALCGAMSATANEVRVWQATKSYQWDPDFHTVTITSGGTFKVEALDGAGGLGYIAKIDVAFTGQPGDVTVHVVRDPREVGGAEHEPGAAEVWAIDLSACENAETTGTVAELRTTGNYGHTVYGGTLHAVGGCLTQELFRSARCNNSRASECPLHSRANPAADLSATGDPEERENARDL